jgi:hypothetical protein
MTRTQTTTDEIPNGTARDFNGITAYWWAEMQTWVTIPEDDEESR